MKQMDRLKTALDRVFAHFKSKSATARALDITPQSVGGWQKVPVDHCLRLEELTGISRYELRPDVYGDPPVSPPSPRARRSERSAA